jgi:hypothetical protein
MPVYLFWINVSDEWGEYVGTLLSWTSLVVVSVGSANSFQLTKGHILSCGVATREPLKVTSIIICQRPAWPTNPTFLVVVGPFVDKIRSELTWQNV